MKGRGWVGFRRWWNSSSLGQKMSGNAVALVSELWILMEFWFGVVARKWHVPSIGSAVTSVVLLANSIDSEPKSSDSGLVTPCYSA